MDSNTCSDNVMLTGIEECVIHIDQTFVESVDRWRGKHGLADVVTHNEDVDQGTFHKIHVMEPRQFQEIQNLVRSNEPVKTIVGK